MTALSLLDPSGHPLFWNFITRVGEVGILMPLVLIASAWLWLAAGSGLLARRWLLTMGCAALLTTATKIAFIGWGWGIASLNFTGISGHSLFATSCLPTLAWLTQMHRGARRQWQGAIVGLALAALVAYSRLQVHAHSPSEALAGFALGAAVSALTLRGQLRTVRPGAAVPLWLPLLVAAGLALMPVYAPAVPTHSMVTALALRLSGHERPFTREDLLRRDEPPRHSAAVWV